MGGHGLGELDERPFVLAADHVIGAALPEEVRRVESRIEPGVDEHRFAVHRPHLASHLDPDPEGGVHGHRNHDQLRPRHQLSIQPFDREVAAGRRETRAPEKGSRGSEPERRVSELVTRDEENVAGAAQMELGRLSE